MERKKAGRSSFSADLLGLALLATFGVAAAMAQFWGIEVALGIGVLIYIGLVLLLWAASAAGDVVENKEAEPGARALCWTVAVTVGVVLFVLWMLYAALW